MRSRNDSAFPFDSVFLKRGLRKNSWWLILWYMTVCLSQVNLSTHTSAFMSLVTFQKKKHWWWTWWTRRIAKRTCPKFNFVKVILHIPSPPSKNKKMPTKNPSLRFSNAETKTKRRRRCCQPCAVKPAGRRYHGSHRWSAPRWGILVDICWWWKRAT